MFRTVLIAGFLALAALPARADALTDDFRRFLEADVWPQAKAERVPRAVFEEAFSGVTPRLDLPDLNLPGRPAKVEEINRQAEFRSGADYLSEKALAGTVNTGRAMLKRHGALLKRIEARYGVPAPVIVAIWGRESAFGAAKIPENAFAVLGTKAWASRRKEMFRAELVAALKIVSDGHLRVSQMRSSWAGALGQPQFMPTKFLAVAVDFDGDGRRDIWNSVPDTLASIANYLARAGWRKGVAWGGEARVPAAVSCSLEGPDRGRPLAEFAGAGVTRVSGEAFSARALGASAHLMMPAGRAGPAFLVSPNFYVVKDYNNSDLYALYVLHAADRMSGGAPLVTRFAATERLTRGDVARLQEAMQARGMDVGGADGLAGFKTRRSIGLVEETAGRPATCWPSKGVAALL
ncbi:lytic murein transglycosylase [Aurantimonas sp. Leaf443]|uniref:lytic murein transglycosylase n=1 Tax=Aurantimonas sp. Leaf443 TaxID=1736378 RepID=UPI0006FC3F3D|nr:lytic murein transglycosylase [Aurantimonas sp. Leaf443]KQT85335.1 hypothetical protein ASG48_08790 [Aurantimonas sp. Leaf443]